MRTYGEIINIMRYFIVGNTPYADQKSKEFDELEAKVFGGKSVWQIFSEVADERRERKRKAREEKFRKMYNL